LIFGQVVFDINKQKENFMAAISVTVDVIKFKALPADTQSQLITQVYEKRIALEELEYGIDEIYYMTVADKLELIHSCVDPMLEVLPARPLQNQHATEFVDFVNGLSDCISAASDESPE
jgi:hypothetical protein